MDSSQRRCFLEVFVDEDEEPRLLQLEPHVKFHNVLDRFDEDGELYWQDEPLDPEATPASLRMPCGVDQANTLWFVPLAHSPSYREPQRQQTPLVESTAALRASPPSPATSAEASALRQGRAPSLPASFDPSPAAAPRDSATAGAAVAPVAWYSRPRLLSPPQPAAAFKGLVAAAQDTLPVKASQDAAVVRSPIKLLSVNNPKYAASPPSPDSIAMSPVQLQFQQQQPPRPPAAAVRPPVPYNEPRPPAAFSPTFSPTLPPPAPPAAQGFPLGEGRRNKPILIDPAILVDTSVSPVEVLQSELRRLQRDVQTLKHAQTQAPRRRRDATQTSRDLVVETPSSIPTSSADASVEELAMELHDKQMRRLYEQRRFYLTHRSQRAPDV